LEQLVVAAVLAPVDSFLTAESPHLLAQLGVGDAILEVAHAVHEEALTFREHQRQAVEEPRDVRITAVPMPR